MVIFLFFSSFVHKCPRKKRVSHFDWTTRYRMIDGITTLLCLRNYEKRKLVCYWARCVLLYKFSCVKVQVSHQYHRGKKTIMFTSASSLALSVHQGPDDQILCNWLWMLSTFRQTLLQLISFLLHMTLPIPPNRDPPVTFTTHSFQRPSQQCQETKLVKFSAKTCITISRKYTPIMRAMIMTVNTRVCPKYGTESGMSSRPVVSRQEPRIRTWWSWSSPHRAANNRGHDGRAKA